MKTFAGCFIFAGVLWAQVELQDVLRCRREIAKQLAPGAVLTVNPAYPLGSFGLTSTTALGAFWKSLRASDWVGIGELVAAGSAVDFEDAIQVLVIEATGEQEIAKRLEEAVKNAQEAKSCRSKADIRKSSELLSCPLETDAAIFAWHIWLDALNEFLVEGRVQAGALKNRRVYLHLNQFAAARQLIADMKMRVARETPVRLDEKAMREHFAYAEEL